MIRRAAALVLVTLVAVQVVPTPEVEAHGGWWDETLRVWDAGTPLPQVKALKLSNAESYDRYAFAVETEPGAAPSGGYIQIRHSASGDIICDGPLGDVDGFHVYRYCDLRVDHGYVITFVVGVPAKVHLYGVNVA